MPNNIKKIINIFLMIIVIFVWGIIVYQLFFRISEEGLKENDVRFIGSNENTNKFVFPDNAKDPFYPLYKAKTIVKDTLNHRQSIIPAQNHPNIKLLGIIEDRSNLTAVLEFDNDSLAYVKEGDKVRGLLISKITQKKIQYTLFGKMNELILDE